MSDQSKIEWCDSTLRLWNGCSPSKERPTGCAHCYATRDAVRMAGNPNPKIRAAYEGLTTPGGKWNGTLRLASDEMWDQPRRWKRGRVIFINSGSDTFHEAVPTPWIVRLWHTMQACPQHTFLILTKRIERATELWQVADICHPLPNVYLGMSASTQGELDSGEKHIIHLEECCWKTFLSLEPLCRAIEIPMTLMGSLTGVIVGGESGPHARPMHPDWVRAIRDQCAAAGVDFFFKQWGEWDPVERLAIHDDYWSGQSGANYIDAVKREYQYGHSFIRNGRALNGRLLDGQTHDAIPWGDKLKGLKP